MSHEQGQRVQVAQAEAQPTETTGDRWGDPISEQRQAELQGYLDRWAAETDHGERAGPFEFAGLSYDEWECLKLTGADVFWLAEQSGRNEYGWMLNLHLEGANLGGGVHLETLYVNTP